MVTLLNHPDGLKVPSGNLGLSLRFMDTYQLLHNFCFKCIVNQMKNV